MRDLDEIRPGVVAYLDPQIISECGLECPLLPWDRIEKVRPYVCAWGDGQTAVFVPMSTSPGNRYTFRLPIPQAYRIGCRTFIGTNQYACGPGHFYTGPLRDFQAASEPDRSLRGRRNGIHEEFLPNILSFVGLG